MAEEVANLAVGIGVNTGQYTKGMKRVTGELDKFERKTKSVSTKTRRAFFNIRDGIDSVGSSLAALRGGFGSIAGATGPLMGVAAAVAGIGFATWKSATAGDAAAQEFAKLERIIAATGGTVGLTADEINDFTVELSRTTAASRSEIKLAVNQMLAFQGVAGDTCQQILTLSQDLAAQGFGDIADNAKTLGEAMDDPGGAIESLVEKGVIFSEQQKEVIKRMQETNRYAEAQAIILERVASKVGGVGQAGGLTQGMKVLGESFTDLGVAINKQLGSSSIFTGLLQKMAKGLQAIQQFVDPDPIVEAQEEMAEAALRHAEAQKELKDAQDKTSESATGRTKGVLTNAQRAAQVAKRELESARERLDFLEKEKAELDEQARIKGDLARQQHQQRMLAEEQAKLEIEASKLFDDRLASMQKEGELLKTNTDLERLNVELKLGPLQYLSEAKKQELRDQLAINKALEREAKLREAKQMGPNDGPQMQFQDDEARDAIAGYYDYANKSDEERQKLAQQQSTNLEKLEKASWQTKTQIAMGGLEQISGAMASHSRKMFELNKIAGIANAIISTARGVTKALELPFPLNLAAAATTAAAGMAQVRAIQSQQFGGGGGGVPSPVGSGGASGGVAPAEPEPAKRYIKVEGIEAGQLFDSKSVRALIRQIGEELSDGVVLVT
jgi:hypothetical protein